MPTLTSLLQRFLGRKSRQSNKACHRAHRRLSSRPLGLLSLEDRVTPTSGIAWLPTAAGTYAWNNASNWAGGNVPDQVSENVLFDSIASQQTITIESNLQVGSLSGTLTSAGRLTFLSSGGAVTAQSLSLASGNGIVKIEGAALHATGTTTFTGDTVFNGKMDTGDLALSGFAQVRIGGTSPGNTSTSYSQINVAGTVNLTGPLSNATTTLVRDFSPFSMEVGQKFVLINNDGTDPITGTFHNLPEGSLIYTPEGEATFRISYLGLDESTGNDVVLTLVNLTPTISSSSFTIAENSAVGATVGQVVAAQDSGETVTFTAFSGDTDVFQISSSGLITVKTAGLDFETRTTYTLGVLATDNGPGSVPFNKTITINVTDLQTNLSIDDVAIAEGNSGSTTFTFTVTSSAAIGTAFNIEVNTADGTATAGSDYTALTNALLSFTGLAAGETRQINVTVNGDLTVEASETFLVNLLSVNPDVVITDGEGVGTIGRDDTATFTIADTSVNEGAGTMSVTVVLSNPIDIEAKVSLSFADVTTTTDDFNHATLVATFAPNSTTAQVVSLPINNDFFTEQNETFTISLALNAATPLSGRLVNVSDTATGTIVDNDTNTLIATINEDNTNPTGVLVSAIAGAGSGMAVIGVDNTGGKWQYTLNGTNWFALSSANGQVNLAAAARLLSDTSRVRFLPNPNFNGTVSFVYRTWNKVGGTVGGTANLSGTITGNFGATTGSGRIVVNAVNDAPVLNAGGPTLTPVAVNTSEPVGDTVASIASYLISDIDLGAQKGIAVTAASNAANGTWEYKLASGGGWVAMGAVSATSARLLGENDLIRFKPNANFAGSATLSFRAWDRSNGATPGSLASTAANNGTTPYSWIVQTATVRVTNNVAPTLAPSAINMTPLTEDPVSNPGNTIASIIGSSITDTAGALTGIAVTSVDNTNGRWQFTTNNGTTWINFTTVTGGVVDLSASARLLANIATGATANRIRFIPNANFNGTSSLSFRAWDRTVGTIATTVDLRQSQAVGGLTSYSATVNSSLITVTSVNDAPVLAAGPGNLTQVTAPGNYAGDTVASFAGSLITDVDANALKGIAITAVTTVGGVWEYRLAESGTFVAIAPVSATSALLLRSTDVVRFRPVGANFVGIATITFRAWDQNFGTAGTKVNPTPNGGSSAFSATTGTANMVSLNDAPVMTAASPIMPSVTTNSPAPAGVQVATLVGNTINDLDPTAIEGIAIIASTGVNGSWQYSLNGTTWTNLGAVAASSAMHLRSTDFVRFLPATTSFSGEATITYRAWDQTGTTTGKQGTKFAIAAVGGRTPYSTGTQVATVRSNNAPVLASGSPLLAQVNGNSPAPTGQTVASFLGSSVSDLDVGALRGIAIIGTTGSGGNWEYSLNGTTWVGVGSVSASGSLLLRSTDFIRFMPGTAVYNGTATITYRAWDQTGTTAGGQGTKVSTALSGGFQAFSSTTQTATAKSNLSPQLNLASPNLPSLTGPTPEPVGVTVAALAGANISDGDVGAVEGIAITATTGESGGTWQYKLSGSSTWVAVGSVAANSSLLLRAEDSIRFLPSAANWYGKATITYRAWDQTGTTAGGQGSKVSTTSNGNPHPFSSGTQVATVRSNIAPKLGLGFPMLPNVTSSTPAPAGTLVSTIVGATITDQDPGAVRGIAIGGTSETDGTWQFSLNGTTWTDIGAIPNGSFFLLRSTDFVRFLPNVTTFIGEASLTYRAWDQTGGTAGLQGTFVSATLTGDFTPYSSEIQTAKVRSNQAPVLAAGTPTLTAVTTLTPAGQTVASFIGSLITDSDAGAVEGIAITGLTTAGGTWQFSLNGGSTWTAVGTVSGDTALLLRSTDMIRFVPTAAGFTGQASITYRAWDQTGTTAGQQGTKVSTDIFGGFTAFSNALQTATVNITV